MLSSLGTSHGYIEPSPTEFLCSSVSDGGGGCELSRAMREFIPLETGNFFWCSFAGDDTTNDE